MTVVHGRACILKPPPLNRLYAQKKKNKRLITSAVVKVKKFIDEYPGHGMSTAALADQYHLSRNTLQEVFKEKYHISIGQYKLNARLKEAQRLLKEGQSIKEVSFNLHYSSPSSFSNAFRNYYNISASEWLQEARYNANKQGKI